MDGMLGLAGGGRDGFSRGIGPGGVGLEGRVGLGGRTAGFGGRRGEEGLAGRGGLGERGGPGGSLLVTGGRNAGT